MGVPVVGGRGGLLFRFPAVRLRRMGPEAGAGVFFGGGASGACKRRPHPGRETAAFMRLNLGRGKASAFWALAFFHGLIA